MTGDTHEGDSSTGIVVAIRESGAQTVVAEVEKLADAFEKLSPTLAKTLRGRALRLGANLESEVKKAAKVMLERIVHTSPHDTGKFRKNWNVSITSGGPDTSTTEETDYDGDSTITEGQAKIDSVRRQPGEAILISNSLPYAQRLNEGWSQQAPAAFVERAVQAGVNSVKRGIQGIFK